MRALVGAMNRDGDGALDSLRQQWEYGYKLMRYMLHIHHSEMPIFDGMYLDRWVFQAKSYFSMNRLFEYEKLEVTAITMDSEALAFVSMDEWSPTYKELGRIEIVAFGVILIFGRRYFL